MKKEEYTTKEAAEVLELSHGRVKQLVAQKRIKSSLFGNTTKIKREDLEEFKAIKRKVGRPKTKR